MAVIAFVVVIVVVAAVVDEGFVGMAASVVVMDWAVSFISSPDAVALDFRVSPAVLTCTLFAASAFIIEVSRSESGAPDSSVFSSGVLALPQLEISFERNDALFRMIRSLKGEEILIFSNDALAYLHSRHHAVQVETHLLSLTFFPLLLHLRGLRGMRMQRRRYRRPETANVGIRAQAALGQLRQSAFVFL